MRDVKLIKKYIKLKQKLYDENISKDIEESTIDRIKRLEHKMTNDEIRLGEKLYKKVSQGQKLSMHDYIGDTQINYTQTQLKFDYCEIGANNKSKYDLEDYDEDGELISEVEWQESVDIYLIGPPEIAWSYFEESEDCVNTQIHIYFPFGIRDKNGQYKTADIMMNAIYEDGSKGETHKIGYDYVDRYDLKYIMDYNDIEKEIV